MSVLGPFQFSKGFSPGYSFNSVPTGYATDMRSCRFKNGVIVPRWGQAQVNDATLGNNYVVGLQSWNDTPNQKTALVALCASKLWIADATGFTPGATALTFTDRTGGTTITNGRVVYTFDSLNGILLIAGNSLAGGVPLKVTAYNANAANLGGSPPKADIVKVVNNIAFLAGQYNSSSTFSTLNWSNVSDPETWSGANSIEVNKRDGEPITALGSIGSDLYIFKLTSIWRLSTITQVVSGIATLGPLQLVLSGVGCPGPLALDNLPNGDIVFVGYDQHVYEFDGSSVFDISKQPFPGPNTFDSSEKNAVYGVSAGLGPVVKTWRGLGEVWIGFSSSKAGSPDFNTYAYDYVNRIWQGYISGMNPVTFTTTNIVSINTLYESTSQVFYHGNKVGEIWARGTLSKTYPTTELGATDEFRVGTTIKLAPESSNFVPRSICFESDVISPANLAAGGVKVYVAYDTFFPGTFGTAAYTSPASMGNRVIFPITMLQDSSTSNVMPNCINIEFRMTCTGTTTDEVMRLGSFYISDEIAR